MSKKNHNDELVQMYRDLAEIFDEEYKKRRLITPQNTAEKMTAKGYHKQSEWISVDERLPEDVYGKDRKQITVLVCTKSGRVSTSSRVRMMQCNRETWELEYTDVFEWSGQIAKKVTHWMPLPEAPKSESEFDSIPVEAAQALKEKAVEKAKAEVASEVIDEFVYRLACLTAYGTISISPRRLREIAAELKKKYTEGNDEKR
jgi:hypothetical protein